MLSLMDLLAAHQEERRSRGVFSMRGLRVSDLALEKMADAGVAISMAANNKALMRTFGLQWAAPKLPLQNLLGHGLPEPFLALADRSVLQQNRDLIERLLSLPPQQEDQEADQPDQRGSRV